MAITRTAFGSIIFTSAVEDPVSSSLALGTNSGRAVVSFMSVGSSYDVTGVSVTSGDSLGTSDVVTVDGFKRYGHAGIVTQTGSQTVTFDTTSPVGQNKWGTLASYDDVASIRSVTVFSGASGTNPSATVTTVSGDKVVMLGISNGAGASLSAAGGATDFDGGLADSIALEKDASSTSTTINGTWSGSSAWYVAVFVLTPTTPPETTPPTLTSGSATGGTLTVSGGITSTEAGTLYWQVNGSATGLTYPSSGTMTGWTSRSLTASAQTWGLGTLTAGTKYLHLVADDALSNRTSTDLVIGPFTVSAGSTPVSFSGTVPAQTGTVGVSFSLALSSYFSGTLTPFTYLVDSGALPGGLSLNTSTGTITGTPTTDGSFSAVIRATDTGTNVANTNTIGFTIDISPEKNVTLSLTTDGTNPSANLTGLKWAFFDEVNPANFTAPTAQGSSGTTNSSGVFTVSVIGTSLSSGDIGWLLISDSDGTISQSPPGKAFSAPVVIS